MMKKSGLLTGVMALFFFTAPALAHIEEDYDPGKPPATTPWYECMDQENIAADLDFIEGMRPHHEGALTMSEEYLKGKKASSERLKALANAIIKNQTFEIGVMSRMKDLLTQAPKSDGHRLMQVAESGLAQNQKFAHTPAPFILQGPLAHDIVSKRDVQFAKAMIIHHEGALDMCRDYLHNPASHNGYMELLCQDILTSQSQEIALMHDIIADYPGDADKVKPSAVHGMEHMMHHGTHKMKNRAGHNKHHHEGP